MKQKTFVISICAIVSIFLLLMCLSSCDLLNKQNKGENTKQGESTSDNHALFKTVSVKLDDFTFEANIYKGNGDVTVITVLSPKTLEGMEFRYDKNILTATFLGMEMKLDKDSQLVKEILKLL